MPDRMTAGGDQPGCRRATQRRRLVGLPSGPCFDHAHADQVWRLIPLNTELEDGPEPATTGLDDQPANGRDCCRPGGGVPARHGVTPVTPAPARRECASRRPECGGVRAGSAAACSGALTRRRDSVWLLPLRCLCAAHRALKAGELIRVVERNVMIDLPPAALLGDEAKDADAGGADLRRCGRRLVLGVTRHAATQWSLR